LITNYSAQNLSSAGSLFSILKFGVTVAVLVLLAMNASTQVHAEEGRIHITFLKTGYGSGSGYLFLQGQKYGLSVSSPKVRRIWITAIDLIGIASNLRSAADIIGTYTAVDPEAAIVRHLKMARLENAKGVGLEIRAVNLNRWFALNLSGMTIKNVGWQPSAEQH
jgi:hypothetical protein